MTPQQLKNSILQLAIQGKLVEQRPEEGTAEALYRDIQAEKARLVKEGKIKKDKPLPEIADDELPFDIPENWKWVKLGSVASVLGGKRIPAGRRLTTENTGHIYIRVSDMKNASVKTDGLLYVPNDIYPSISRYIINKEDIYITVAGTIGSVGTVPATLDGANLTENADRIVFSMISQPWFVKCLQSNLVQNQIANVTTKVGQPKLAIKRIQELLIPLPPLAEQKRIVARIEELLPLVDRYEQAWTQLQALDQRFPADLQKSILQLAIQGRLVEQRPEEGTAEALYRDIQAEKARLAKEGKIKKEKPLPAIADDELPFDIPESWTWVRLNEMVVKTIKRGKSPVYISKSNTLVFAQKCNTKAGHIDLSLALYLDESRLDKYTNDEFMQDGDIIINSTGRGTLGRVGIYRNADNPLNLPIVPDSHVTVIRVNALLYSWFVLYALKHYQPYLEKLGSGSTNQTELSAGVIRALCFPLPPLAEQKRIVARIEELLPLCEALKHRVS